MNFNNKSIMHQLSEFPEDVTITDLVRHENSVELIVTWPEPTGDERLCPHCKGTRCIKKDNGTTQTVRHLPAGFRGTLITFHKPRFLCRECGKSFYIRPNWVMRGFSVTVYLFYRIYQLLTTSERSVTDIAHETMTSPAIVQHIIDRLKLSKPSTLPETIGIDEFHGSTGTYDRASRRYITEKYHCVITDADAGAVIDILKKPGYGHLKRYFMEYPLYKRQNVRFFCADMRSGFSKVARECFPNARICIDPFHVVKLITEAVSEIRVEAWRSLRDRWRSADEKYKACSSSSPDKARLRAEADALEADYTFVRNSQRLLITSPFNENTYWADHWDEAEERLKRIFALWPDLELAHDALYEFYDVADNTEFLKKRSGLTEWLGKYRDCECHPIKRAAMSIEKHRKGIENAWRFHKSNSPTEGLNKKIKDVKRLAFGAHKFSNFRKRALLACGYDTSTPATYTIFAEKATADPTEKGADDDR